MTNVVEILDGIMGSSKALMNGTPVVTPEGYTAIEKLSVGDEIYGEDGELHTVQGVYPQGVKRLYKVTFSDRNFVICCEDHLWTYQHPQDKAKGVFRTDTLKDIMNKPLFKETNKGRNWNIFIPIAKPVKFTSKTLSIHPYLLGLLLGDGSFGSNIGFTNSEHDIRDRFEQLVGEEMKCYQKDNTFNYRLNRQGIYKEIRKLYNEDVRSSSKFIPKDYLLSCEADRYELLKGLLDTDGHCKGGYFQYSTTSSQLAKDVKFLTESLGCTVTTTHLRKPKYTYNGSTHVGQDSYILFIRHDNLNMICSSEKHLNRITETRTKPNRSIRSIDYYGEDDCTCIMVSNPSKLFLTEHFIPTHNTTNTCKWMEQNNHKYKFFYISPLLDEVRDGGRIQQACPTTRFVAPMTKEEDLKSDVGKQKGISSKRKIDNLLELLKIGANITCTHSLYLSMTDDHFKEMEKHQYVLIIDEELGMIDDYKSYSSPDVKSLQKLGCVEIQGSDGMLVWKNDEVTEFDDITHRYHSFKRHVENEMIYVSKRDANIFVCQLPIRLITVAKRCIILTYMFNGNVLSSFLKLKGLVHQKFDDVTINTVCKKDIMKNIKLWIPKHPKWRKEMKLSVTAYHNMSTQDLKHISNYILAVTKDCGATDYDTMFTFPKDRCNLSENKLKTKIKPKGLVDTDIKQKSNPESICWISSSTRATNKFKHKKCVIHAYDRYPNQSVSSYLQDFNFPVDRDVFAISEMLQWIWRSRIRDNKSIDLAILSPRMQLLFLNWLHDLPLNNEDYTLFSNYLNWCKM